MALRSGSGLAPSSCGYQTVGIVRHRHGNGGRRRAALLVVVAVGSWAAGAGSVGAGSVAAAAPTTPATTPGVTLIPVPTTPPTTQYVSPTTAPPTTVRATTVPPPAATTTTSTTFPLALLAQSRAVHRTPASNTSALLAALAPLQPMGYTAQQAAIAGMGQFPVAGPSYYADDWLEPRPGNPPRLHLGDDIVAASGTPLRAPTDGVLRYDAGDPGGYGLAAIVTAPDHTFYLMGHLSATVKDLATGSPVKQGQVVGFVGATGDATGPHCHFEIHPLGGAGVDPKPFLDAWQAAAMAAVPGLIQAVQAARAVPVPVVEAVPVPVPAESPALPGAPTGSAAGRVGLHLRTQPATAVGSNPLAWAALLALVGVVAGGLPSARRRLRESGGPGESGLMPVLAGPGPAVLAPVVADEAVEEERLRRWLAVLTRRGPDGGGAVAT